MQGQVPPCNNTNPFAGFAICSTRGQPNSTAKWINNLVELNSDHSFKLKARTSPHAKVTGKNQATHLTLGGQRGTQPPPLIPNLYPVTVVTGYWYTCGEKVCLKKPTIFLFMGF